MNFQLKGHDKIFNKFIHPIQYHNLKKMEKEGILLMEYKEGIEVFVIK